MCIACDLSSKMTRFRSSAYFLLDKIVLRKQLVDYVCGQSVCMFLDSVHTRLVLMEKMPVFLLSRVHDK